MTSVLHLDDVSLHRGSHQILSHVSWTVEEGQHWVLLGSNGAGKTTIARIASARLFPSSGTVDILSERLGRVDVSELHPRIGLLSSALAADVQDGEKVLGVVLSASYGRIGRWREEYDDFDLERAHALLGALEAGHLVDRLWGTLSSGERKRVELARALMPDPEMLFLDEPASGLDLAGREQLLAALTEIISSPDSPSMVLVTHHLEEIPEGFTHALTLREGKVVGSGPLEQVLTVDTISTTFGMPLEVTYDRGRYAARGRPVPGADVRSGPRRPRPARDHLLTNRVHQEVLMEWLIWVGGALLLIVIETVTADLTFLMIAGGALGGGLTSFLGGPVWAQVLVFACVSTLLLFAVRPWAKRRLAAATPQMKTNVDALIGRSATTITAVDDGGGRVRLGGEEWSARLAPAAQGGVTRLEAGVSVTVTQIDGAVAVVAPATTSAAAPAP